MKIFAWIGWVVAAVLVALRIRGGGVTVKPGSARIVPAKDQADVPGQDEIEAAQRRLSGKGMAVLVALAVMAATTTARAAPIILSDADQVLYARALAASWEYKGFLEGKAIVRILDVSRVDGDQYRVLAVIGIKKQDGGVREVEQEFFLTIRAGSAGGGVSWLAAVGIAAAGFLLGYAAGK